jgi:uncharacterized membrane protein YkvI
MTAMVLLTVDFSHLVSKLYPFFPAIMFVFSVFPSLSDALFSPKNVTKDDFSGSDDDFLGFCDE